MPATAKCSWTQLSVAFVLLLVPASCMASLSVGEISSQLTDLKTKAHHRGVNSDNNTLTLQQLASAQFNAWSSVPQFAELVGL